MQIWRTSLIVWLLLGLAAGASADPELDPPVDTAAETAATAQAPDSESDLQAAKAAVDALGLERDDAQRLELISKFLEDYPGNYWRHVAYRYWIYTCWHTGDIPAMKAAAELYLKEYPGRPECHGAVSRYYYEADIEPEAGLASAQHSVELYERELGISGELDSLVRLNAQAEHEAPQLDYLPPGPRAVFRDYLGSRFNLARYLVANGQYDAALGQVEPVIALDPLTTEEEQTLAPFYLTAGDAMRGKGNAKSAYRYYLGALVVGDSRNRYAVQAKQHLPDLADKLSTDDILALRASFIPAQLTRVVLPQFTDITSQAGLGGVAARRLAWGDLDGDGDPDLLADGKTLLRNDGRDGFVDVSAMWGLGAGLRGSTGGAFADYDNDGDLDFYATGFGARGDRLWRNDGAGFVNVTPVMGDPTDDLPSEAAAWLDYDSDGLTDLYVANYESPGSAAGTSGSPDRLYHNEGYGRFTLVDSAIADLTLPGGSRAARGVSVADYDSDGLPDIFVGNYLLQHNTLWRNMGDGTFSDEAHATGVAGSETEGLFGNTLGSAWGDIDNDGDLDLFSANLAHPRFEYFSDKSQLLISEPGADGPVFSNQRAQWGVKYAESHCDPLLFDCNNDGWLDLYITCIYDNCRSYLYLNDGQGKLHDVTYLSGAGMLDVWSIASADFDGDGDLDVACGGIGGIVLLRNDTPAGNWLEVVCAGARTDSSAHGDGTQSNRSGIGAHVVVTADGQSYLREIQSGRGIGSGDELIAHFGLGASTVSLQVQVTFPSGAVVTQELESANRRIIISELDATPTPQETLQPAGEAEDANGSTGTPADAGSEDDAISSNEDDPGFKRTGNSRG